jgi:hypothetical protein
MSHHRRAPLAKGSAPPNLARQREALGWAGMICAEYGGRHCCAQLAKALAERLSAHPTWMDTEQQREDCWQVRKALIGSSLQVFFDTRKEAHGGRYTYVQCVCRISSCGNGVRSPVRVCSAVQAQVFGSC